MRSSRVTPGLTLRPSLLWPCLPGCSSCRARSPRGCTGGRRFSRPHSFPGEHADTTGGDAVRRLFWPRCSSATPTARSSTAATSSRAARTSSAGATRPAQGSLGLAGLPGVPNPLRTVRRAIPGLDGISYLDGLGEAVAKAATPGRPDAGDQAWASSWDRADLLGDVSDPGPARCGSWQGRVRLHPVAGRCPGGALDVGPAGVAAFKREGGWGRALIGAGQFVVVCACWFGYCTLVSWSLRRAEPCADGVAARRQYLARLGAFGRHGGGSRTSPTARSPPCLRSSECFCGSPRSGTSWFTSPARPPYWC